MRIAIAAAALCFCAASPTLADTDAAAQGVLAKAAAPYALVRADARRLEMTRLAGPTDMDQAYVTLASHAPDVTAASWAAYVALASLQTDAFVRGVEKAERRQGASALINTLAQDPSTVRDLRGADAARKAVVRRLAEDAEVARSAEARVRSLSYALQNDDWAKQEKVDNQARLARIISQSKTPRATSAADAIALAERPIGGDRPVLLAALGPAFAWADSGRGGDIDVTPALDTALDHALALAAISMVQPAAAQRLSVVGPKPMRQCLVMSRLILEQCVAAAHFGYEDPYCIAEHGLGDVADCFTTAQR